EEYDEETKVEPRPVRIRKTTLVLRTRSSRAQRQIERVVKFEDALNRDGGRVERNFEGRRPSEYKAYDNRIQGANLPPLLAAQLGKSETGQSLQSSLTSVQGGRQPTINIGGNIPPNVTLGQPLNYPPYVQGGNPSFEGTSAYDAYGGYAPQTTTSKDIHAYNGFIFVHRLRTRSLVEFLSTYLLTTYKGLIEKTYTWIKARKVATNGTLNDHQESFHRFKKNYSWDNNKGKKNKDRFSPYRGSNHGLLSNLFKSPREILATEKVSKTFEQPPCLLGSRCSRDMSKYCHFHEDHGHDTNQCRELRHQIKEAVRSGQLAHLVKGIEKGKGESLEHPTSANNSSDPVIIKARIFGRKVNRVYMDSGSSCEVIYEYCFLKLKPSIRSLRVDSKISLVGFSREHSWPPREVPLEITIGDSPFIRTEILNFVTVRSNSSHNPLLRRTVI
ncbi:hypothetical protein Tco_1000216, partial [Tanacetum coccineum]